MIGLPIEFVGVWMEHLQSGRNPRCHQFVKYLSKYVYKISIMQLTPKGVKWISWFLACCYKSGFQPTFKLFHQLFVLIRSNHLPLYELHFQAVECDYGPRKANPVIMQTLLKFWNREGIFLKSLDLAYMPHIVMTEEAEDFQPQILKDDSLCYVFKF